MPAASTPTIPVPSGTAGGPRVLLAPDKFKGSPTAGPLTRSPHTWASARPGARKWWSYPSPTAAEGLRPGDGGRRLRRDSGRHRRRRPPEHRRRGRRSGQHLPGGRLAPLVAATTGVGQAHPVGHRTRHPGDRPCPRGVRRHRRWRGGRSRRSASSSGTRPVDAAGRNTAAYHLGRSDRPSST